MTPVICLLLLGVSPPDDRSCAEAVIAAVAAHERSTHTIRWTEHLYLPPSHREGEDAINRPRWTLVWEDERYAAEDWSWFLFQREDIRTPPIPDCDPQRVYFGVPGLRMAASVALQRGMLAINDGYFTGGTHLWRGLGRGLDYQTPLACRSLEDLLRRADRIEYVEPTDELPWPGVRARTADPTRHFMDLEVRVDPACAGLPRSIISRYPNGWAIEHMVVVTASRFGDAWLPLVGIQATFTTREVRDGPVGIPQGRQRDIAAARSGDGLPPALNTPAMRQWIKQLTQIHVVDTERGLVRGPMTLDSNAPLVAPQIFVVTGAVPNAPMHPDEMFDRLPSAGRFFNGCTGEWTDADGIRRFWKGLHP